MENEMVGEVKLEIGDGRTLVLRPDFPTLIAIEKKTGKALTRLVWELSEGEYSIGDLTTIVQLSAQAYGHKLGFRETGEAVIKAGLVNAQLLVLTMLTKSLMPPEDVVKNSDGPAKEPTTE